MNKEDDLSVAGPGSPVSLKKFLLRHQTAKPMTVLLDQTGTGIAHDDEGTIYITPEECSTQALYYSEHMFNGVNVPAYLYRYITYMMMEGEKEYMNDQELAEDFKNGTITAESDSYKQVVNLIKYCKDNPEMQQVMGLIQLIGGSLNIARKADAGIRLYLDRPETSMHPKRQARFMSCLMKLQKEYGFEEEDQKEEKEDDDA